MITLHQEAETIEELRALVLAALDLRNVQTQAAAAASVEALKAEPVVDDGPVVPDKVEAEVEAMKPAKKTRAPRGSKKGNGKKEPNLDIDAAEEKLTRDSVRAAFNKYVNEYGVGAAQTDGPVLLGRIFGNGITRIGDVPEDSQEKLQRIINAVDAAIFTNEFNRTNVKTVEAQ